MADYGHELEFGVFLNPAAAQPQAVVGLAEATERAGLEVVSFQDHPYQARFLDTWTLLSYIAARTSEVKLAPNVLNLPLRSPSVMARSAASLDLLSGGRVELGLGAGAFWDAIAAMGGRRLKPGESVEALEEAITVMRALWDTEARGGVQFEGEHYGLKGAARGPAPAHRIGLWIGAYKPRMLRLTGRLGDGWLPSVPYLNRADLASGSAVIDEAARKAGRGPHQIRRVLNVGGDYQDGSPGPLTGSPEQQAQELAALALEEGISTFLIMADDPATIERFAAEVVPAVREIVATERARRQEAGETAAGTEAPAGQAGTAGATGPARGGAEPPARAEALVGTAATSADDEYARLGVTPTADDGRRLTEARWDESTRPHRTPSGPEVTYTDQGRRVGEHLIDVHDALRKELTELRGVVAQVQEGAMSAGDARSELNAMALRQNDWTLGAFCSRYCRAVAQHHTLEDDAIFPHLKQADPELDPVIDRLHEEHLVIHDAIEEVDRALVHHINNPEDFDRLQAAIDTLTDTLLSHLSYEEYELVEPLARHGFYAGQV